MRTTRELGLKITAAQREYFRYTGSSAEAEHRGAGCSHPERTWIDLNSDARISDSAPDSPNRTTSSLAP